MDKIISFRDDTYKNKIKNLMAEYIKETGDSIEDKMEWLDEAIEGISALRIVANIEDIPMRPAFGLQDFANTDFSNGYFGSYMILFGYKDGYLYHIHFEEFRDKQTGMMQMGLNLYRNKENEGDVYRFLGSDRWRNFISRVR